MKKIVSFVFTLLLVLGMSLMIIPVAAIIMGVLTELVKKYG